MINKSGKEGNTNVIIFYDFDKCSGCLYGH